MCEGTGQCLSYCGKCSFDVGNDGYFLEMMVVLCWFASCTRDWIGFLKIDKSVISGKNNESWFEKQFTNQ